MSTLDERIEAIEKSMIHLLKSNHVSSFDMIAYLRWFVGKSNCLLKKFNFRFEPVDESEHGKNGVLIYKTSLSFKGTHVILAYRLGDDHLSAGTVNSGDYDELVLDPIEDIKSMLTEYHEYFALLGAESFRND